MKITKWRFEWKVVGEFFFSISPAKLYIEPEKGASNRSEKEQTDEVKCINYFIRLFCID